MNSKWTIAAAISMGSLVITSVAQAQGAPAKDDSTPSGAAADDFAPATRALELTVATGYQQGFGSIASGQPTLGDLGQAGGALQIGVGYRVVPQLTLGVYGSGATFGRGDQVDSSANLYSASAGAQADWHFLPAGHQVDPWVSLGTGWRGYWIHSDQGAAAGTTAMHGWEIGKLQVGVDFRVDQAVAVSPVVGADLTTFFTESTPQASAWSNIASPQVNTFVFAGVQGRFDIPTGAGSSSRVASR